jgi:hypothetical protein
MKKLHWIIVRRLAGCEGCGKKIEMKIVLDEESKELLERVCACFESAIQSEKWPPDELKKVGELLLQALIKVGYSGLQPVFASVKDSRDVGA